MRPRIPLKPSSLELWIWPILRHFTDRHTDTHTHAAPDKCKRLFRPNINFPEVKADRHPSPFHFQFLIKKELGSLLLWFQRYGQNIVSALAFTPRVRKEGAGAGAPPQLFK